MHFCEQLLNHELLHIVYCQYILVPIASAAFLLAMDTSSSPYVLLFKCMKQVGIILTKPYPSTEEYKANAVVDFKVKMLEILEKAVKVTQL